MVAQTWLDEELNNPNRTDHYIMRVAAEVQRLPSRVWGQSDPLSNLDGMKITFGAHRTAPPVEAVKIAEPPATCPPGLSIKEQEEELARQMAMSRVGGKVKVVDRSTWKHAREHL